MKLTEQQLHRAIYSMWDFQQALSALTFLLEDCDFDKNYSKIELRRFRCYETTLIISYCRPFEDSRSSDTLGLRALGVRLNEEEKALKAKLMSLRRKAIAHSDEGEMHYRVHTHKILEFEVPQFQYDEGLNLGYKELRNLEAMLRRLKHQMYEFFFKAAQDDPDILNRYKVPESIQQVIRENS